MKTQAAWIKTIARRALPNFVQEHLRAYYLTLKVLGDGEYVEPEMAVLGSLISPGQVAVDIGANVGFYTKLLSELVGPSGQVYSFEPVSDNFRVLDRVVVRGRLANVKTFFAAVDHQPGENDMIIPDKSDFTGFYQARLAADVDSGRRQHVKVVSLDQLWNDEILRSVDFVKCDAEGSELGILKGGIRLLAKSKPSMLVEIQRKTSAEVFDLLHAIGYKSYVLNDGFTEISEFAPEFWNYFFFYPN
jgi:FkbM family methyltransferase